MSKLIGEITAGDRSGCDGDVGVGVWPWKAGARPDSNRRDNFRLTIFGWLIEQLRLRPYVYSIYA